MTCISFAEQRHLTDTQIRLEDNTNVQRQLNETARYAEMDLRAKKIDQRLEVTVELLYRGCASGGVYVPCIYTHAR